MLIGSSFCQTITAERGATIMKGIVDGHLEMEHGEIKFKTGSRREMTSLSQLTTYLYSTFRGM